MVQQNSSQKITQLRCTKELTTFLKKNAVYGESLEDVIWRLIATKKLTGEQDKDVKKASYEKHI